MGKGVGRGKGGGRPKWAARGTRGKEGLEEGRAEGERASEIVLSCGGGTRCGVVGGGAEEADSRAPKKVYFMYLASTASRLPLSVL